jgi:hypothetical protein
MNYRNKTNIFLDNQIRFVPLPGEAILVRFYFTPWAQRVIARRNDEAIFK